ncbi:MAG TPA: hypothetical protein VMV25_04830 [Steroidobacteraceae bacterium]|nr:hypothetical protein [Steroidobacteraceae bacterium]
MIAPTRASTLRAVALLCVSAAPALCPWPALAADAATPSQPYQMGQGLYFPAQALRVGGYADLQYYGPDQKHSALSLEDLSLFLTKDVGSRWKFFTETELSDALSISHHQTKTKSATVDMQRLYADYRASDVATIRFGKFLTPVGQWNLVHADPLVWTTSRPLTTTAAFSRHMNGAMMYGTVTLSHNDVDYWLFVDDGKSLSFTSGDDDAYDAFGATSKLTNDFQHAVGGQFLYHLLDDRLSLGASLLRYELKNPRQQYRLAGLDFDWTGRFAEWSGEAVYRTADNAQTPDEYGGFLQAVVPLPRDLYLVGRYERYRNSLPRKTTAVETLGINYRPLPSIVVKFERIEGSNNDPFVPSGWFASLGLLF